MLIKQSVTFDLTLVVPDHHTIPTGRVAAETATRLILRERLMDEERGGCQIVKIDKAKDIYISTLDIIKE